MNTRLTFEGGNSHKEYNVTIEAVEEGFTCNFAYGRIDSSLTTGTKTPTPVSLEEAQKIADKLLTAKIKKGYVASADAPAEIRTVANENMVVELPQLSVATDLEYAMDFIAQNTLIGQVKCDGERRTVFFRGGMVTALNRRGVETALNPKVADAFAKICEGLCYESLTLDCEDMGDHLYCFDCLEINNNNLRDLPFHERADILADVETDFADHISSYASKHFSFADSISLDTATELRLYVETHRCAGEEGVILRTASGLYESGRPTSANKAPSLKIKFTNDCQVRVTATNPGKRSVRVSVQDVNGWREVGSVTIPVNVSDADYPQVNDIINVGYLWVISDEGSLIQPTYQRKRTDLTLAECTADQLVVRPQTILNRLGRSV